MAKAAIKNKNVQGIQGDWLGRDLTSWRVRVPCIGGSGRFNFAVYGGSEKALIAARRFQKSAIKMLESDRAYYTKHGELPYREALPINNKSGYLGVYRVISPRRNSQPLIMWVAAWPGPNGRRMSKTYTTAQYLEPECKARAIKKRAEMIDHILLPTN